MRHNLYYIQDTRSFTGNHVMWWGKDNKGYVTSLDNAEIYTYDEAVKIIKNRNTDVMWDFNFINSITSRVVDMQELDNSFKITQEILAYSCRKCKDKGCELCIKD